MNISWRCNYLLNIYRCYIIQNRNFVYVVQKSFINREGGGGGGKGGGQFMRDISVYKNKDLMETWEGKHGH
jgi:hypothetical protein